MGVWVIVGGLEGQHLSLRASRDEGSFSSPPSTDPSENPSSCALAGKSEGRRIRPQLPDCDIGVVLA